MAENRENKASLVGGALACVCCEEDSGTVIWRRAETQAWTENHPWAPSGSGRHVVHSDWIKVGKQRNNKAEKRQPGTTASI